MLRRAALPPELQRTLDELRRRRRFDVDTWLAAKIALLGAYLERSGIRAAVVGVSGGVDSALALALLRRIADATEGSLERLIAVLAPIHVDAGATNQDRALARGREVAAAFGAEVVEVELGDAHRAVKAATDAALGVVGNAWSSGQLVSTIRTPAFYYVTSLLAQEGWPALLCGTTNRDEGSYLGFFGKASDGMVDLQVISDLHKSEVYAAAARLGVPASVLEATPTGDTFDGRPDEAMIGAPYDFVELYTGLLALADPHARIALEAPWSADARARFDAWAAAVEALHAQNHHKYLAGANAIHVDVYPRHVPGGWSPPIDHTPPKGRFVGEFVADPPLLGELDHPPPSPRVRATPGFAGSLLTIEGLLSAAEAGRLRVRARAQAQVAVGVHGVAAGHDPRRDPPGSTRASTHDPALAEALWRRLWPCLPPLRIVDARTPTDHEGHPVWRPVGVSPLLRFITYPPGASLVPHRDATFDLGDDRRRTLMSVIIALSPPDPAGGGTRFLVDRQRHLPLCERDLDDHEAAAPERDVLFAPRPAAGDALVFDHRLLHEGARGDGDGDGERVILRTDVIFERCGPPLPARRPPRELALCRLLGVAPEAPPAAVDEAYARARDDARDEATQARLRLAWRLLRDPYYASAYARVGDEAAMIAAGFFDDGASLEDAASERRRADPAWMNTPLHRAREGLAAHSADGVPDGPLTVLLTTGAFCPIHRGHLEMMERAKAAVEAAGGAVIGGYISVSHDSYVLPKCGPGAPGAAERLAICEAAIAGHPWLMVDPWEALSCDRAVNFTDVIHRLEGYLNAHLRGARPIEVVHVFGSDNAGFTLAFAGRGRCVCVPRPGHEARLRAFASRPEVARSPRILIGDAPTPDLASRQLRAGDPEALEPAIRGLWRAASDPAGRPAPPLRLYVRDEGAWAIEAWHAGRDPAALAGARARLFEGLLEALRRAHGGAALELVRLDLGRQRAEVAALRAAGPVVSLDPCVAGDLDLALSRCFELAVDEALPYLVHRPGHPPLAEQLAAIPTALRGAAVTLVDDDVISGRTIAAVRSALAGHLRVAAVRPLCSPSADGDALTELCDSRDLLPGARAGGLVVALPDGARARAPYLLPYVRPSARLRIPVSRELAFSREVWVRAAEFFDAIEPAIRVADADPAFRALTDYLGVDPRTPMAALCRWHAARLAEPWAAGASTR